MIISAGLAIIYQSSILLVLPQGTPVTGHYSIPKGVVKEGESLVEAAIRETFEEIGILFNKQQISKGPFIINYINRGLVTKRLYYYLIILDDLTFKKLPIFKLQKSEVKWAGFIEKNKAKSIVFWRQWSILNHIHTLDFNPQELSYLEKYGIIRKEQHSRYNLSLYNYTEICKRHQLWDETTLWCRGLVLDSNFEIIARPFKKFFSIEHIYEDKIPDRISYKVYEKLDGSLGILYWADNKPLITTRGSFFSSQAIKANEILYSKYNSFFHLFNKNQTLLFEIIYPENRHVVNYGTTQDLFLIGAVDLLTGNEIDLADLDHLPFPKVPEVKIDFNDINELKRHNIHNKEGFIVKYANDFRIKIKFDNYLQYLIKMNSFKEILFNNKRIGTNFSQLLSLFPIEFHSSLTYFNYELELVYSSIYKELLRITSDYSNISVFLSMESCSDEILLSLVCNFYHAKKENLIWDYIYNKVGINKSWSLLSNMHLL